MSSNLELDEVLPEGGAKDSGASLRTESEYEEVSEGQLLDERNSASR